MKTNYWFVSIIIMIHCQWLKLTARVAAMALVCITKFRTLNIKCGPTILAGYDVMLLFDNDNSLWWWLVAGWLVGGNKWRSHLEKIEHFYRMFFLETEPVDLAIKSSYGSVRKWHLTELVPSLGCWYWSWLFHHPRGLQPSPTPLRSVSTLGRHQ